VGVEKQRQKKYLITDCQEIEIVENAFGILTNTRGYIIIH